MKREGKLPELLAPAGGEAAFYAALAAGADAVYLGGKQFNARAFADNFDDETLRRCLAAAHARGVRVYVTMNTLLFERELGGAVEYAARLYEMGVDALICADVGLMSLLHARLPELTLHASTQLSLHSALGAREIADLNCETVVAARELSRENIAAMAARAPAKVETFAHGALCVCHSGQCLFSSMVGGRSGNRGECAQPCRLPYNGGYPLSLRDLSLAAHIPALLATGTASLKIEGRMKSPAYVWGVTRIYRRLLDEGRAATPEETRALAQIFSRDGFTDGYFTSETAKGMQGVRREEDKQSTRATAETAVPPPPPVPLTAHCTICAGKPATLTLTDNKGKSVTVTGETPAPALRAPLTPETVAERLCKLGGTPYEMTSKAVQVEVEPGLNLSPAALNALRRAAVERLLSPEPARLPVDVAPVLPAPPAFPRGMARTAVFLRPEVWEALGDLDGCFDMVYLPLWELDRCRREVRGVWLPPVITDGEEPQVRLLLEAARKRGATHALCGNPAQIAMAREAGFHITGDFRLNITNTHAAAYWAAHGVEDAVLSPELTAPQLREMSGRVIVWGRIPLMLTERCYASDGDCRTCRHACERGAALTDRRGARFPVVRVWEHRNLILNSIPTYLSDRRDALPRQLREHYLFTNESAQECRRVIRAAMEGAALPFAVRRLPK